jgi:hypothetical protein
MKLLDHIEVPYNESDKDITTTCLWCGSEDKLSMSKDEGHVFSCWKCKQAGNALSYMREWYAQLPDLTMPQAKQFIQLKPGVSPSVLRSEGIKFDGGYFWFPVRNAKRDIIALHKYNPSDNITYASPKPWNCSVLGISGLSGSDELWIAEGHADYLVMRHILSRTSDPPDLLGTCGSGFSGSYLYLLEDKDVVLLFDNDDAGQSGVKSIARRVKSSGHNIKYISYIDWSSVTVSEHSELPKGYDVRDWYNSSI